MIAFIPDERLPMDRKTMFARLISVLKPKFNIEVLSSKMTEEEFIAAIKGGNYSVILVPWYKYLSWKKLEHHFGALRLQGPTVAGYFSDAVLPFEFSNIPNYHRMLLLDFYRFDQFEIEMILGALVHQNTKSGFAGIIPKNSPIYYAEWFDHDAQNTRCIDAVMQSPLLKSNHLAPRVTSIRFFLNALWSICFQNRYSTPSATPCALIEVGEFNRRLAIKLVFENSDFTLKNTIESIWPNEHHKNPALYEMIRHCDFLRIHHFPESHHIELTAFFVPTAPSQEHPAEVRGFWIEPQKTKYLKNTEEEQYYKRVAIQALRQDAVRNQLHEVLEQLRAVHVQLGSITNDERVVMEHQITNIKFLVHEIEKKVAEKKKSA